MRDVDGETVIIFDKDHAVAEMRPLSKAAGKRPIGLAKGDFVVPDDFNDPLPEDVLKLFEGERLLVETQRAAPSETLRL